MNRRGFFGKFLNALAAAAVIKEMPLPKSESCGGIPPTWTGKHKMIDPATGPYLQGNGVSFVSAPFDGWLLRVSEDGRRLEWYLPPGTYEVKNG